MPWSTGYSYNLKEIHRSCHFRRELIQRHDRDRAKESQRAGPQTMK